MFDPIFLVETSIPTSEILGKWNLNKSIFPYFLTNTQIKTNKVELSRAFLQMNMETQQNEEPHVATCLSQII